jgi:Pyruvate/2-oxoacid:ferredoxin oxidoreductase gamma subunit
MDTFASSTPSSSRELIDSVVIRFAGDSGDGMQLTGSQFTDSTALMGNDLSTLPDFPAEIRAPAGTTFGVSGFQVHFAGHDIKTPGDAPDVLVAMNPAALRVNLRDLKVGGLLVCNTGAFTAGNLKKAGYDKSPLDDGSLDAYRLLKLDVSKLTLQAVEPYQLGTKEALRAKNMWTLGLMMWMFGRERESTVEWLRQKFAKTRTSPTPTSPPSTPATSTARPPRCRAASAATGPEGQARPGRVPQRHRQRGDRVGSARRRQAGGPRAGARLLPDHPGLDDPAHALEPARLRRHHLPGRGRDRGDLRGHRRVLRGRSASPRTSGPGLALKAEASASPSTELPLSSSTSSAAAPRPACRPRPSRATCCRPSTAATATARSRSSPPAPRRLLRHGDRGRAPRHQVHDAGAPAHRRLHRQRAEPWRSPNVDDAQAVPGPVRTPARGLPPVPARPADPRARLGDPGHARPRAPHRRHREGLRLRQHLVRPGQPPQDDEGARGEDRRHRRRHPAAEGRAGRPQRRPRGRRLGLDLRRDRPGRDGRPPLRPEGLAPAHPLHEPDAAQTSASCCAASSRSACRR